MIKKNCKYPYKFKLAAILLFSFVFYFSGYATTQCQSDSQLVIKQVPIDFNAQRIALTKAYRFQHYGINSSSIEIIPQMIVLHWTAFPTAVESFAEFYPPKLHGRPDIVKASILNTSAQFLVDRDGTIYQLMPDNWMARQVIGLNNIAIGIENVGGSHDQQDLTEKQVQADVQLIFMLKKKYPSIKYLIGHYEYSRFKNTPLWLEKDKNYFTKKVDPGEKFMREVRKRVKCLQLYSHYSS